MSHNPRRPHYSGSLCKLEFTGEDFLKHNHHLPTMIHTLGVQVDKDTERPEIKSCGLYRISVTFEEIESQRGKA